MNQPRFNTNEHIALYKVGLIVLSDLGWVYRTQPVGDVGMDALVEETLEGNPSGRFLMFQVKSGLADGYEDKLNYYLYLTQTHYQYYTNVEMPVIIVLCFPHNQIAHWSVLNESSIRKTPSKFKVALSKNKQLGKPSIQELTALLDQWTEVKRTSQGLQVHKRSIDELLHDAHGLENCVPHLLSIAEAQRAFSSTTEGLTKKVTEFAQRRLTHESLQLKQTHSQFNRALLNLAKAINLHTHSFVDAFTLSGSAIENLLQLFLPHIPPEFPEAQTLLDSMIGLRTEMDSALPKVESLLRTVELFPTSYRLIRPGRNEATKAIDYLVNELRASRSLLGRSILLLETKVGA